MGEPDQLYSRVLHFSTDKTLGVRTPQFTKIIGLLNPIQHKKQQPISLKCSREVNKNWPLGHGQFRISGNLGPLVPSVTDAKNNGFDDVLWLLDDYIKECTILNVFILQQSRYGWMELVTPDADTCILNGVTRQTIIDLKDKIEKQFNLKVVERQVSIHEVINSSKEGRLFEMFGASTHCPLIPINRVVYRDTTIMMSGGDVSKGIDKMLMDKMKGNSKWVTPFE